MTTTDDILSNVTTALQPAEELGGPQGDEYAALMEAVARLALERAHRYRTATPPGALVAERRKRRDDEITAAEVIARLAAEGISAEWEFPGYIRVVVPGGHALAYGTANGTWDGHLDGDESGHIPDGWDPESLPADAAPSKIYDVLLAGYRQQIGNVARLVYEALVDIAPIAEREHIETSYGWPYHDLVNAAKAVASALMDRTVTA